MRRFTRLTNAFSKKLENHAAAIALHRMYYIFVRIHQTLRITPAIAAGVTDKLWEVSNIVAMLEQSELANYMPKYNFVVQIQSSDLKKRLMRWNGLRRSRRLGYFKLAREENALDAAIMADGYLGMCEPINFAPLERGRAFNKQSSN